MLYLVAMLLSLVTWELQQCLHPLPRPSTWICVCRGHAFTLTKADFSAHFHRLMGDRVLFPFAFHCTGMPIQVWDAVSCRAAP